uniref:F-box domain-containing protein n=1 Tax=Rhizophagus irregularis (strain DAOM 181602 / DAOM 197198 / MUCL 43194) TaxID=747089 RepID=U9T206_RHIID
MPCQLPYDCLIDIFEYLNDDKNTLYSCLLVNSLWCVIAVRILWRDVWKFYEYHRPHTILLSIINTLIAFLPKKSKRFLHKNGITIPIQKRPLFNYASFCKIISIDKIVVMTRRTLDKQQSIISKDLENVKYLSQEILKMFMNQISSLKALEEQKSV